MSFERNNPRLEWQRLPATTRFLHRWRTSLHDHWLRWLILAGVALVLVFGFDKWGNGSGLAEPTRTVHAVSAGNMGQYPAPATRAYQTSLFVTRATAWAYSLSYFCLTPRKSLWAIQVQVERVMSHGTSPVQTSGGHVYRSGISPYTRPIGQVFYIRGAGSYRFVISAAAGCTWSLHAPPVQLDPSVHVLSPVH